MAFVSADHDIVNLVGYNHVHIVNIGQERRRISKAESRLFNLFQCWTRKTVMPNTSIRVSPKQV